LSKQVAVIDHHELGDDVAEGILVIDPSYCATALLLFEIWDRLGFDLDAEIAQCLLTGIATDTGGFKFQNTDAKSLHAAAELVKHGANITEIHNKVWDSKPLSAIRLLAVALGNIQVAADGAVVYSRIQLSDYVAANATDEDTEGIVNEIGKLDSAIIFALFREHHLGRVRVSVRSRGEIDVAEVCRALGGGGHKNAAGCTFETDVDSAVDILLPALEAAVTSTIR
jgi:phosphoesterase RecJ-like protein